MPRAGTVATAAPSSFSKYQARPRPSVSGSRPAVSSPAAVVAAGFAVVEAKHAQRTAVPRAAGS